MELTGNIKTTIVCDDAKEHVYEIIRELDTEGEEIFLLTLYATLTTPNELDLSCMHVLNHADDETLRINKIHFIFLFSKVAGANLSTKGLKVDEENLEYIRTLLKDHPKIKLVISYGASMDKAPAVIESKVKFFSIVNEVRPDEPLWQIDAEGMEGEANHILYCGIRYGAYDWSLRHYIIPQRFTEEGYKKYLEEKEVRRELFIKNVLGKKAESCQEEKHRKGKKKSGNTES